MYIIYVYKIVTNYSKCWYILYILVQQIKNYVPNISLGFVFMQRVIMVKIFQGYLLIKIFHLPK